MLNVDKIKSVICDVIEKKRTVPSRCPCTADAVPLLRRVSDRNKRRLSRFLSRINSGRYSASEAGKCIDEEPEVPEIPENETDHNKPRRQDAKKYKKRSSLVPESSYEASSTDVDAGLSTLDISIDTCKLEEEGLDEIDAELRDKRGRQPQLPQWKDQKCLSIADADSADSKFFTACLPTQ